jgi:hypothetical protein
MKPAGWAAVALACVLAACVRSTEGVPVAGDGAPPASPQPSSRTIPTPEADLTEPGIMPTTQTPVPADTTTCEAKPLPPVGVVASIPDPAAPKIAVALPSGWGTTRGDGDVGVRLEGPDRITATVTITQTTLDPADAFRKYADDAMAAASVSSVSVLPGDLCGYSGQKLVGAWSDSPQRAVEFGDRIAHIWTNTNNYLVAVHVEAPAGTPGFDPMFSPLMNDFSIVLP